MLVAGDIDRDGDEDILGMVYSDDRLVWYRNTGRPGADAFVLGEEHFIDTKLNGIRDAILVVR